jgi:hypothetical protein
LLRRLQPVPQGVRRVPKRKGVKVYAYKTGLQTKAWKLLTDAEAEKEFFVHYLSKKLPDGSTWGNINKYYLSPRDAQRDDPILVEIVKEMGAMSNGHYAELKVVEIPDDVEWVIEDYDGSEWIAEKHRTWR